MSNILSILFSFVDCFKIGAHVIYYWNSRKYKTYSREPSRETAKVSACNDCRNVVPETVEYHYRAVNKAHVNSPSFAREKIIEKYKRHGKEHEIENDKNFH